MNTRNTSTLIIALALGAAAAIFIGRHRAPEPTPQRPAAPAVQPTKPAPPPPVAAPPEVAAVQPPTAPEEAASTNAAAKKIAKSTAPKTNGGRAPRELVDPVAREALAYVGSDPVAESYWLDAITDPTLPDQEHEDLIEDLNEVGYADLRNPTQGDIDTVVIRLRMLEWLSQDVMQDPHMDEAYKDLVNMYRKWTGQEW